ncbi:MAG: RelA/SpoT family protein [Deltaproteobacteria bacterium]|nr:RelA/SpoT family protein [Deltaproteobacteria bacterium]
MERAMAQSIEQLISTVGGYSPLRVGLDPLLKAYEYTLSKQQDSRADIQSQALTRALGVCGILAELHLDRVSLAAGLLHDALEPSQIDMTSLRAIAGEDAAGLVEEVNRLSRASFQGSEASRAENMREMILASTRDLRVILILLAGQLQQLRDAKNLEPLKAQNLAREARTIFAPIAHRLGVHFIKAEMEDIAFSILEPEVHADLQRRVDEKVTERSARIVEINQELKDLLRRNGLDGEVLGRTKHLYSIHNKMKKSRLELDKIYDVLATRIIVGDTEACYRVLGLVHAAYTPIPGRFKDYIALPKSNGYQSLHTLVFGSSGDLFEIQIRTRDMHQQSEMGIAAHFSYKDGRAPDTRELASVTWFRQLLENLEEGRDPAETMELVSRELEPTQLFLFTPKGEVVKLAAGATPIDFAYAVHTEVGNHCTGAKVDGRIISIRTPLRNGSVVEIMTHPHQEPKEDWLKFAISSKAQGRIRSFLRKKERVEAVILGRELLAREAKRAGFKVEELLREEGFAEWMRRHSFNTVEDLYAAEGFGRVKLDEVLSKLFPSRDTPPAASSARVVPAPVSAPAREKSAGSRTPVTVAGMDQVLVRFAKCCTPVHGDPLQGIITRGHGVSVHHRECGNLKRQVFHTERLVDVEWQEDLGKMRPVTLVITTRRSMKDLLHLVALLEEKEGAAITEGRISSRQGEYTQHLTLMIKDSQQLKRVLQRLNAMEGIRAERELDSA